MPQAPTDTNTRYELRTKDGTPIVAQWDLIPGKADLHEEQNLTPDGKDLEWQGGTELIWDAQEPERRYGETLFADYSGNMHLAGDLVIAEITKDDECNETVTTRSNTLGIQYPLLGLQAPSDRIARALELAQWVTGSNRDVELGTLTPETRDRVHTRARVYAQGEGVSDLLQAILGTLKTE